MAETCWAVELRGRVGMRVILVFFSEDTQPIDLLNVTALWFVIESVTGGRKGVGVLQWENMVDFTI